MSRHFLGLDVGGTASRYVVVDDTGAEILRGAGPAATGHLFSPAERGRFTTLVTDIAGRVPPIAAVHAGITGYGDSVEADTKSIVAEAFVITASAVTCSDDMDLAYHAVFAPGQGHVIAAGTGTIGLHIAPDGSAIRVGGRGILIDDAGSGSWIALTAINRLYRRIDEAGGPADAAILAKHLYAAIGGTGWDDVRAAIYGRDRGAIGELAQAVAAAAREGDPLATAVLGDAVTELARLARALIARAGRLPVAYVGRVPDLHPMIATGLRDALRDITVSFPKIDAALHAARMARGNA
jgi:N-acetylglucosamine kinase-like BadF-type ATPase